MIRHADDENFAQAVQWAGMANESALDIALRLVKSHDEMRQLLARLRPETEWYRQAEDLLREMEQAPHNGDATTPAKLRERQDALRTLIEKDLQQPFDPEQDPPFTRERYAEWQA